MARTKSCSAVAMSMAKSVLVQPTAVCASARPGSSSTARRAAASAASLASRVGRKVKYASEQYASDRPGIRGGVVGIERDRLLERIARGEQRLELAGEPVDEKAAPQVQRGKRRGSPSTA